MLSGQRLGCTCFAQGRCICIPLLTSMDTSYVCICRLLLGRHYCSSRKEGSKAGTYLGTGISTYSTYLGRYLLSRKCKSPWKMPQVLSSILRLFSSSSPLDVRCNEPPSRSLRHNCAPLIGLCSEIINPDRPIMSLVISIF